MGLVLNLKFHLLASIPGLRFWVIYLSRTEYLIFAVTEEKHQIWSSHFAWEQKVRALFVFVNLFNPFSDCHFLLVQTVNLPYGTLVKLRDFELVEIVVVSRRLAGTKIHSIRFNDVAHTLRF